MIGETDALARVCLALAADFERDTGAQVMRDPVVLSRLAEAYLRATAELRGRDRVEMRLPFLSATPTGPVHFERTVTAAELAELASREPQVSSAPSLPPKRKGWWPF